MFVMVDVLLKAVTSLIAVVEKVRFTDFSEGFAPVKNGQPSLSLFTLSRDNSLQSLGFITS